MEQHEGFFQELKQIYDIKIPIPEPSVIQQNHIQKFLFYIDLTNTQKYYNEMSRLSINHSKERQWQGGQIFQFQFNNKKREQQSIFCYQFNKLLQDDEQINIQNLFRFRIFFQEFIQTQQNYQIKFVFHFLRKNQNDKEFQELIIDCIYQILEGSFKKLSDIICVYNIQNKEEMNYCKISSKKIHLNKNNQQQKFDISYIILLDEFLDYVQFKQDVPNQIGFICYQYVQSQVDVVLKEFEKELLQLYKDILQIIEFPVNLNNEIEVNQNVSLYLESLKTFIADICIILSEKDFYKMAEQFKKVIYKNREKMIQYLNNIVQENSQFEIYLEINYKDKKPNKVFNQLLQFQFHLPESDIQIIEKLKLYQYNEDVIKKTLYRIILDINQQFKQFDLYLPQSLAYVKRIIPQKQNANLDKPYVFVLGMTKVGKSTLLNILNNPENIIVNQDKKFDVKQKNNKILLSHSNASSTFQTENLEIDNFIFVDTPGLRDTYDINRGINHFNIFNSITKASQQILLLMIDGEQLQTTKNDLIDSIILINNMLGDQQDDKYLENFIIPVFTKIRNASTMEQIINKWQTETMKDITDQKQLNILKIIKNAIDQEKYIKIYQAECYEIHQEVQQLESEIQRMQTQYFKKKKDDQERQVLEEQIQLKQEELDKLNQEGLFQKKIQDIKEDVLGKCKNLLKRKEKILKEKYDIVLNFEFKLTDEMNYHIQKLLPYRQNFYQHLLNRITIDFIAKVLFDDSISINDKHSEIFQTLTIKMNRLTEIPKNLINQNIQDQIKELDEFNNIILKYDHQNQDPQKVDFQYFQIHLKVLLNLLTKVTYIYHDILEILQYEWKRIDSIKKIGLLIPNIFVSFYTLPIMLISAVNQLFIKSIFVTQKEKEKEEKMKMLKMLRNYIEILEKTSK